MLDRIRQLRPWLAAAGVLATAAVLLPPGGTLARQYAFAQAGQYAVLAVVVPALVVLGAPWRLIVPAPRAARSDRPGGARPWAILAGYLVVAIAWRLPAVGNALVRHPMLAVAEAVCLIGAGCALWLELVESPPFLPRISRPQRAAFAALPMWTMWAAAYILGFSGTTWLSALARSPGRGLGTIADQEIAVGLLWAIPGLCFAPVVFVALITWLRDGVSPDEELREVADSRAGGGLPAPRPPRGWR